MSESIGKLMDEYDEASKEFRQTESKDSFKRKTNAYEAIAKTVYLLESELASLQSRLAEFEEGFDPKVQPAPETWVLMMDCDGVYFPVQFDPLCMWYWNYRDASNIDYWNDDDIDLRKWFPLPGSKGGEE